jgi:hypothetical protein
VKFEMRSLRERLEAEEIDALKVDARLPHVRLGRRPILASASRAAAVSACFFVAPHPSPAVFPATDTLTVNSRACEGPLCAVMA